MEVGKKLGPRYAVDGRTGGVWAVHGATGGVGVRPAVDARARWRRHPVDEAGDRHAWAGWEERRWRVGCCCGLGPEEQ
jgi:hypothetical protein